MMTEDPQIPERFEGWLEKKGSGKGAFGRRNWKKRWFVLDNKVLSYFVDQNSKTPKGFIILHLSDTVQKFEDFEDKQPYPIKLATLKRTLLMNARNPEEQANWISAIKSHIQVASDYTLAERTEKK